MELARARWGGGQRRRIGRKTRKIVSREGRRDRWGEGDRDGERYKNCKKKGR